MKKKKFIHNTCLLVHNPQGPGQHPKGLGLPPYGVADDHEAVPHLHGFVDVLDFRNEIFVWAQVQFLACLKSLRRWRQWFLYLCSFYLLIYLLHTKNYFNKIVHWKIETEWIIIYILIFSLAVFISIWLWSIIPSKWTIYDNLK